MKYMKKIILKSLNDKIKLKEKIIFSVFKNYTFEIYKKGYEDGFNFSGCNTAENEKIKRKIVKKRKLIKSRRE